MSALCRRGPHSTVFYYSITETFFVSVENKWMVRVRVMLSYCKLRVFQKPLLHPFNFFSFSSFSPNSSRLIHSRGCKLVQNIHPLSLGYILLEKCSIHPTGRSNHLSAVIDCSKFPPAPRCSLLLSVYVVRVLKRLSKGERISFIGTFRRTPHPYFVSWGILLRSNHSFWLNSLYWKIYGISVNLCMCLQQALASV